MTHFRKKRTLNETNNVEVFFINKVRDVCTTSITPSTIDLLVKILFGTHPKRYHHLLKLSLLLNQNQEKLR